MASFREFLVDTLPKAAHKKIDAIVAEFEACTSEKIGRVEVEGARVGVETIEVYGLEISLDANGNAVAVTSPYGFSVAG